MKNSLIILLLSSLFVSACTNTSKEAPNIVFIIADDLAWTDLACYGNEDVQTLNIDRLAREGLKFNNAILTASSCSPSRTSIITGRYPHNTGAAELHTEVGDHLAFFPEQLREAGYYTAASGKWHMGANPKRAFDTLALENAGPGGEAHWINILQERPAGKPFFLWLASFDPHRGWSADEEPFPHHPDSLSIPPELLDTPESRQDLASYYNEIQRFDRNVGMVHRELIRQGVAGNTLIIVMSDNGGPWPREKTRVNDGGMKTPFIVWWPKGIADPGRECDALISAVDLAPTLVEIARGKADTLYQGRSFKYLLDDPDKEFRNYAFAEHNWHDYEAYERMLRTKDLLYVYNGRPEFPNQGPADAMTSPSQQALIKAYRQDALNEIQLEIFRAPRSAEELYDLNKDPLQYSNVIEDTSYSAKLEELRSIMEQWRAETRDTEPEQLTRDWYLREADTYVKTAEHGIRGEMPGAALGADTVIASGPF